MALKRIGALWIRDGAKGKFMSGEIEAENGEVISVLIFKNNKGDNPKRPDYQVFVTADDEKETGDRPPVHTMAGSSGAGVDDDIPF